MKARVNPQLYLEIRKKRESSALPVLLCVPMENHNLIGREVFNCRTQKRGKIQAVNRRWRRRDNSGWYIEVLVDYGGRLRPHIMGKDFGGDGFAEVAEETKFLLHFVEEVA